MEVQVMDSPCLLLEAVEALYAYLNRIPVADLAGQGAYSIPAPALQQIIASVCEGYSDEDPMLRFFFEAAPIQDDSGERTCLARNMVYLDLESSRRPISEAFAALRRSFHRFVSRHEFPVVINGNSIDFSSRDEMGSGSLDESIRSLLVLPDYQEKLCRMFGAFDWYTEQLCGLLTPACERLSSALAPWVARAEPLRREWASFFCQPELPQVIQNRWQISAAHPYRQGHLMLHYLSHKRLLQYYEEGGILNFLFDAAAPVRTAQRRVFQNWELQALRLLGSAARIQMLQAMREQPMSTLELAHKLHMHVGTVGRDISSLRSVGLLIVEEVGDRRRYRTSPERIDALIGCLESLKE